MLSRIRQRIQAELGLTKSEAGILVFLVFGLLIGGATKVFRLDRSAERFDFTRSDSLFAVASAKVDSIVALDEDTTLSGQSGPSKPKIAEGIVIDLNVAGVNDLTSIPGVGRVTAERIFEYRRSNGKFRSVEELSKVKGIGTKKLEKIRPFVKAE